MATTTGNEDIVIHQENDDHDGNNTGDDTMDATSTVVMGSVSTGGAAGGPGTTNFNLRVKKNKIPEFFGTKSKDTILAVNFIR
jgi:hypothetical protein